VNHAGHETTDTSRLAFQATVHCLTGCGIGEVLGLGGATLLGLGNAASIVLGIVLAYVFGYGLTFVPLVRAGMPLLRATGITFAAETLSITTMEIVDNVVVLAVPGAMDAGLGDILFWGSLALSLALAFVAAFPVNRWLIARGLGHAVMHSAP
jgi:putative flippase GtrA